MEYRDDVKLDQSRIRYGGGGGGGRGGMALGGGIGGIVVLVLVLLFGGNLGDALGQLGMSQPEVDQHAPTTTLQCDTAADIEANRDCRWVAYENAIQGYWSKVVKGYQYGSMQLFSGSVQTACGTGSSQMGPFYCPGDQTVYIDTKFAGVLLDQLGASGGDAAEAYILGHEFGHHISNLTGQMQQGHAMGDQGPKSGSVRLELQADCYAGVFFNNTLKDPTSPIKNVTKDDLLRIVDAARAVGDDHIQEQQGGRVVPESWTHGSSEMRQRWVAIGFKSGNPMDCDTFSTDNL